MSYDHNNIFAKILRGEIPCKKVYEDEFALAFHDIHPQRKIHVLVIPKSEYATFTEFAAQANEAQISGYIRAIKKVADTLGVTEDGYRILSNVGGHGGQEVPHLHVHLFAGENVGPMVVR
ncbi:MAG: histidine triad nucleotide-binding protein [Alphaproteobacteria bacterium RIFOXYD12_FULL_60_8]|nr:MAG: histidine triad nucleotide-binding protein [Alphaproteobacteria bacterium RIFOXYD12_FULL_60_8]